MTFLKEVILKTAFNLEGFQNWLKELQINLTGFF